MKAVAKSKCPFLFAKYYKARLGFAYAHKD
jgi:hypothetical protein